jgi:hypothetical protein
VGVVLVFIPLVYILGTLFSTLSAHILTPFRIRIRNSIFPYEEYKDELIAYRSSELYTAYTARSHRVRLMGASIFNWFFLGVALLLHTGFRQPSHYLTVIIASIVLVVLSAIAWYLLIKRSLEFRKNAIDVIESEATGKIPRRQPKKKI